MSLPVHRTSVPGLDEVLGGGLPAGGLVVFQGQPGAGKTILSAQIAFQWARAGKDVLMVSLLSESHGKLVQQLGAFDFFDESLIPSRIELLNGYESLAEHGIQGLLELLTSMTGKRRPALLILDGFGTLRELERSELEISQFAHQLNALVTAFGCTAILLDALSNGTRRPEHAVVDGLLELSTFTQGARLVREFEVRKLRAADALLGKHAFRISSEGITLYPRLEAASTRLPLAARGNKARVGFGIARLDEMLHGGLVAGASTVVLGGPGSGKTLLGLKFLEEGIRQGEPGLYFGFYESPDRLLSKAEGVGIRLYEAQADGTLHILWQPPLEHLLDELGYRLLDTVRRHKVKRVMIDGIEGFQQAAVRKDRLPMFLTALTAQLRAQDVETILSEEQPLSHQTSALQPYLFSALVENVIHLRYIEVGARLHRLVCILKIRESDYDSAVREFRITSKGIEVAPSSASAALVLAGTPGSDFEDR